MGLPSVRDLGIFICVCLNACVCCVCIGACGGQRTTIGVALWHCLPLETEYLFRLKLKD